jgi:hypothetical protein
VLGTVGVYSARYQEAAGFFTDSLKLHRDHGAEAIAAEAASLFQATGNMVYLPWRLEGLAGLAAARGDYERAAELDGARDALRNQIGVFIPRLSGGYSQTLQAARANLTQADFGQYSASIGATVTRSFTAWASSRSRVISASA